MAIGKHELHEYEPPTFLHFLQAAFTKKKIFATYNHYIYIQITGY